MINLKSTIKYKVIFPERKSFETILFYSYNYLVIINLTENSPFVPILKMKEQKHPNSIFILLF